MVRRPRGTSTGPTPDREVGIRVGAGEPNECIKRMDLATGLATGSERFPDRP